MGHGTGTGWRISLRTDYFDQSQLRSGTSAVSPSRVAAINHAGCKQEVERQTIHRYWTLTRLRSCSGWTSPARTTAPATWSASASGCSV